MNPPDPTTLGVLVTALTSMGGAIGVLWRHITKHIASIETKLQRCEDDRADLWRFLAEREGKNVDELKSQKRTA